MTITKNILLLAIFLLCPNFVYAGSLLRIVTSLDPLEAQEYIAAFERDTGSKVDWIRLSAGEALARLKSEAKNPTQDVWFGAPINEFIAAKKADLLTPYKSSKTLDIPSKWRDKDGYWTGIYFGAVVFITREGYDPPFSWADLLKPEYRGEIVVSYPYTAGTGYAVLSGIISVYGEEAGLNYYEKLDKQIRRYTKSGGAPIVEVGLGEASIGIVFDQDALRKGVSRGFPLRLSYPADGTAYEIGGVAIVKGGEEASAGRFIDWITSIKGQGLMEKWYRVPLNRHAKINPMSKGPSDLKLAPIDFEAAGKNRERLINKWREKIGK